MKLNELTGFLESIAPLNLQESYDNSGLLLGDPGKEIDKVLVTLDITEEVVEEAVSDNCDLIIAHHPLIFKGLKSLTGKTLTEKLVVQLIKADIAVYAIHTNLDNISQGVNNKLADQLELTNRKILQPLGGNLLKLVTFCPDDHAENVRLAIFEAGAGKIGDYDSCSFNLEGKGSFRALEGTNPFVGERNKIHFESEQRIETIVPEYKLSRVIKAMIAAHPYEEVAYDLYPLKNTNTETGAGMIGELKDPVTVIDFLQHLKNKLGTGAIRHNKIISRKVKKVAICGGSGAFLIKTAAGAGADIFVTGDVKYHDFFEHQGQMTIVDAGHFETEQFTKQLIADFLKEKFPTFAVLISKINTNPVDIF